MRSKITICLMTLFFLAIAILFGYIEIKNYDSVPIKFNIRSNGSKEIIEYWEDGNGLCYVFLPSYADLAQVQIKLYTFNEIQINGKKLKSGMNCSEYELNCTYFFSYIMKNEVYEKQIIFVQSDAVSTMYINTDSHSMDYILQKIGNEEGGNISLYTANGELDYKGPLESIKGRGNATWTQYMKRPYVIHLKYAADLLGMGKGKKWILLANAGDPSHMRNKLVYDFASKIGMPYTPDSQWVDIYLNGEYAGLYLLTEKIETSDNRVAIKEPEGNVAGSYIVSLEPLERMVEKQELYITTLSGMTLRINEPTSISDLQIQAITEQWQSIENAIVSDDGNDFITGKNYLELIDLDSWARKYLIEEVFANIDGGAISQYFYCENMVGDYPVYAGPVWDYDSAIGNRNGLVMNGLITNREYFSSERRTPWFYSLYNKKTFYNRMVEIFENEFLMHLNTLLKEVIPTYKKQIEIASYMDGLRWPNSEGRNIDDETIYIVNYLNERINFLTDIWINNANYCYICVDPGYGGKYLYYAVKPGGIPDYLSMPKDTDFVHYLGWYDKYTNEPININEPIYEDQFWYILGELKE